MSDNIKENFTNKAIWKRALFMLIYSLFYTVAEVVLVAVVIFQFFIKLFTGTTNARALKLGQSIATYIYQIIQYLTFNSDYQPYPFGAWPKSEPPKSKIQIE